MVEVKASIFVCILKKIKTIKNILLIHTECRIFGVEVVELLARYLSPGSLRGTLYSEICKGG